MTTHHHIDHLLASAVKQGASDIHLSGNTPPHVRINGTLKRHNHPRLREKDITAFLQSVLSAEQYEQVQQRHEIDSAFCCSSHQARFRLNAFYANGSPCVSIRVLQHTLPTLAQPNYPSILATLCQQKHGLILVTGPTGSGKSTTLAAMINHINQHDYKHIITLEDPIEYLYQSKRCLIHQRQIGRDSQRFACALRSAMREDPDIIILGEMRDLETVRHALTAAETGHLVFATLHTSSACAAIDRIINVFPSTEKQMTRLMLANTLQAVVAQTLVNTIDNTRVAAFEIMINNAAIKNLIRENNLPQIYSTMQTSQHLGMCTMDHALEKLTQQGIIRV